MPEVDTLHAFAEAQAALGLTPPPSTDTPLTQHVSLTENVSGSYTKLNWLEKLTIRNEYAKGATLTEIAAGLKRSLTTVHNEVNRQAVRGQDVLALHGPELAETALRAADKAADQGNHKPALDLLLHGRQVDQLEQQSSAGVLIQIGIAPPGTPGNPLTVSAQHSVTALTSADDAK